MGVRHGIAAAKHRRYSCDVDVTITPRRTCHSYRQAHKAEEPGFAYARTRRRGTVAFADPSDSAEAGLPAGKDRPPTSDSGRDGDQEQRLCPATDSRMS